MDELDTADGLILDRSAYENHADIIGASPGSEGVVRSAFNFDIDNEDWIDVPRTKSLQPTKAITATLWYYLRTHEDRTTLLLTGRDISSGVEIRPGLRVHTEDSRRHAYPSARTGEWVHLGISYKSGEGGKVYVNGKLYESLEDGGDIIYPKFHNSSPTIGSHGGTLYFVNGYIDDVCIYDRALSEDEIWALYNMWNRKVRRV